jgi:hypothetical protein
VSSDEYMPCPQTEKQHEFEARIKEYGTKLARRHGISRRQFFKTAAGMAAAFVAMNETYGPLYAVSRAEAATPEMADERAKKLKGQFVMDMHTHFLRDDTRIKTFINQRATVGKLGWNPQLGEKEQTIGDNTNKHLSKWPFRLDDEKIMYPFYEKLVKWSKNSPGLVNVCIHKGLFPPEIEKKFPHLLEYSDVRDVGKAARDWPQLNFVIYHSGWRWTGPNAPKSAWEHFEKTGRIEWITDLAEIPAKYGVKNVYGDLGQLFAWTTTANPRLGAAVMGTLIKGLDPDHVVWGTDAVWTGAPQWQIEALRRLEIPEDMQRKYGYRPLGPADGPVKCDLRRQQRAALQIHAEDAGRTCD